MCRQVGLLFFGILFFFPSGAIIADSGIASWKENFAVLPYVFNNGSGTLQIGWRHANPTFANFTSITFFQGTNKKLIPITQSASSSFAELPVGDCGFGEQVSYQVPGMDAPATIEEIPCPNSGQTARFSFIADAQEGPEYLSDLAVAIAKFPGSAVLNDGDLVQTGSDLDAWLSYFHAMEPIGGTRVTYAAVGNHEYRGDASALYWSTFFRLAAHDAHYSVYIGDVHLIVLNSNFTDDPSLINSQLPWLEQELAKPAAWKFVMFHHAPYSLGFFNSPEAPKKEWLDLQQKYVPLFEAYGVDMVLTGHTHIFERSVKAGIQYLVAGPAGGHMGIYGGTNPYSLKSFRQRTVTNFEVSAHSLRAVTFSIDGDVLDDLILNK